MRANKLAATLALGMSSALPVQVFAQDRAAEIDPTRIEQREDEIEPDVAAPIYIVPESVLPVPTGSKTYDVGAILVAGNKALPDEVFLDIVQDYSARTLSEPEIAALVEAIANRARTRGYVLATATIEPQSLSMGVLRVTLDEGAVDEIRLSLNGLGRAAIERQLQPLVGSGPITLAELERRVLIAGDVAGISIRSTRLEREDDRNVLFVAARRDKFAASVSIDNDGSEPVGPLNARIDVAFNGLLAATDEVDLTFATSLFEPEELQYLRASYAAIVTPDGLELGVVGSYSATRPGDFLASREILGRSWRAELKARYPLFRSRQASLWLESEFEVRDLRQDRGGLLARRDRLAILRAGAFGYRYFGDARLRGRVTLSRGLDVLGATRPGDPLASRSDASGQFSLAEAWLEYRQPLLRSIALEVGARGQLSSAPLLITEDLGLGGPRFLRAYDYNERSGDEGIMAYGELQYDWDDPLSLAHKVQLYGYLDGGVVDDIDIVRNDGSLFSAGGGMRLDVTRNLDIDLELAFPLSGPRFGNDDSTPKVNFSISQDF